MTDNHAIEYSKVIELNIVGFCSLKSAMLDKLTRKKKMQKFSFYNAAYAG